MAVQVIRPQKQMVQTEEADDSWGKIGQLAGAALLGGAAIATGGLSLAAAPAIVGAAAGGASLGGLLGSVGNKQAKYENKTVAQPVQSSGDEGGAAMARRLQQKSSNELQALMQAENALAKAPPSIQQEYAEPIMAARKMAQQKYGVA